LLCGPLEEEGEKKRAKRAGLQKAAFNHQLVIEPVIQFSMMILVIQFLKSQLDKTILCRAFICYLEALMPNC